jgi:hypothetical protein
MTFAAPSRSRFSTSSAGASSSPRRNLEIKSRSADDARPETEDPIPGLTGSTTLTKSEKPRPRVAELSRGSSPAETSSTALVPRSIGRCNVFLKENGTTTLPLAGYEVDNYKDEACNKWIDAALAHCPGLAKPTPRERDALKKLEPNITLTANSDPKLDGFVKALGLADKTVAGCVNNQYDAVIANLKQDPAYLAGDKVGYGVLAFGGLAVGSIGAVLAYKCCVKPAFQWGCRSLYESDRAQGESDLEAPVSAEDTNATSRCEPHRADDWSAGKGSGCVTGVMTGVLGIATTAGGWLGYGHVAHALNIPPVAGCVLGAAAGYIGVPLAGYTLARPFREGAMTECFKPMIFLPTAIAYIGSCFGGS